MTPLKMNSRTDFLQEFCLDFKECLKLSADDSSGSVL